MVRIPRKGSRRIKIFLTRHGAGAIFPAGGEKGARRADSAISKPRSPGVVLIMCSRLGEVRESGAVNGERCHS